MIDTLLTLCLARQDVQSKLLAADIVALDGMYASAIQIMNSYSFAGSNSLQQDALLRKSLYYPYAWSGGYTDGLAALDSLKQIPGADSIFALHFELYPLLYSRLSTSSGPTFPKENTTSLFDRVLPSSIIIGQNYPNPFSTLTSFTFKLPEAQHLQLRVYNAFGQEAATVADRWYGRGIHSEVFQAGHLPSGIYFYKLITAKEVIQKKMLLVR